MDLPGFKEANELGYELGFYNGSKSQATYYKGNLCLTINSNNKAILSSTYKLVELRIVNFSFPNKNIEMFERQILACLPG
jgi:hypothetical protein